MGDRERGALLIALSVGLLVVTAADLELGAWRSRVELGLVALGILAGVVLLVVGRR
jgi:hypothetical protein